MPKASLEIYLPILNIEESHVSALQDRIGSDGAEPLNSRQARRLIKPLEHPRTILVNHGEVYRLHDRYGAGKTTPAKMGQLKEFLDHKLPDSWSQWSFSVPTLPTKLEVEDDLQLLTVAGSMKVMRARRILQGLLANYYEVKPAAIHKRIWLDDTITRPCVGRAHGLVSSAWSRELEAMEADIRQDDQHRLLPAHILMGGVKIEHSPPIDSKIED